MTNEQMTEDLRIPERTEPRRPSRIARTWRGTTGVLAAGSLLLALAVIGVQVHAGNRGLPGPGAFVVTGHVVAAVVAVAAQVVADRRGGRVGALCGLVVLVAVATSLWLFWYA
ncbi:hypothetical protein [Umezawaea beigongshangensis]|uniref:hypothetical protein n=1 Tax=Umezawaea beigongshangensis TaxID=2780383 RepID=UPI0027DD993D|nr:hypothetical protein [Umezawaea beigongshangensis]